MLHKYLFIFSLFVLGCGTKSKEPVKENTESVEVSCSQELKYGDSEIENYVIVLCDLTTSLNDESVTKVSANAGEVLKKMPNNTHVSYYQLSDESYGEPFFKYDIFNNAQRPFQRTKLKKHYECLVDSLKNKVLVQAAKEQEENNIPKSCVLRGFKLADTAFRAMGARDASKYNFRIIVLSDMLEECGTSLLGNGNIYMKEKNTNSIKKAISNFDSKLDLSYTTIDVIITSSNSGYRSSYVKNETLENMWESIFRKLKVKEEIIKNTIPFSSSVPNLK